ncbi:DUF2490 domain-containing protein [Fulvivirga sp. M361]|nr:DUF2490 domain-containing protein [Fulvivirga sp. M361]
MIDKIKLNINLLLLMLLLLVFSTIQSAVAQDGVRFWYGHSAQARITKEWRVSVGQLFLFRRNPTELGTIQNSLNVQYRLNSKVCLGLGYQRSGSVQNANDDARNRLTARIHVARNFGKIRLMNYFRAEWHSPERSKFEYRLRYAFRIHRRNWRLPLRARPYITNEFHYYLSGRPLWYRDEQGERVIRQSPRGLHAHRLTLGVTLRPIKRTNVNLRFMRQTEFNLGNKYRRINVEDPRNGRIRRRFSNFSAMILSVSYRFKVKK